jgi:2-polyprenyl-6-methoxyphenol hydroxylase-like FAD-dependent oxidoreductase
MIWVATSPALVVTSVGWSLASIGSSWATKICRIRWDGAPDAALDAYHHARRPIAQQVLTLTGRLTRMATLPRPLRPLRNTAMGLAAHVPAVRRGLAWRLSGLIYR